MTFENELKTCLKSGIPAMYIETTEWLRFASLVKRSCKDVNKTCYFWNVMEGLRESDKLSEPGEFNDFIELLTHLKSTDKKGAVFVLEFAGRYFDDADALAMFAVMLRYLRDKKNQIIVFSPILNMPTLVRGEFEILDFPLPDRNDIKTILRKVAKDKLGDENKPDTSDAILDSVRGLGSTEIQNTFSKVAVACGKITAEEIPSLIADKAQIIRKSGHLEFIKPDRNMDSIGGLGGLKTWLKDREIAFSADARKYQLGTPKGVLLLGVPGTGKSLCAKAVASSWKMPLLRLDMGRVFGGLVGESESNMRSAIKVAEGLSPCVLWIDEIEKGLAGGASSGGERDGGTSVRVFGSLLTWMQEKTKEVFVFATANDVSKLPPELLRKGRFDEIFFVDLPSEKERKTIFDIHLKRKKQSSEPTDELLKVTQGFSGSEIEAIVQEALFLAVQQHQGQTDDLLISTSNLMESTKTIVPLSTTMSETIEKLRKWANARCRLASNDTPPEVKHSKNTPRLCQEISNPFD